MSEQKARDDFSLATIKMLADRAGHLCSNPECRVLTKGAKAGTSGSAGIGVAAHITAAAIRGPRYDAKLTREQRKSYDNGIWLCQSCARIIDIDIAKYPVSMLQLWKEYAEEFSNANIGKKLYDESTVRKEIVKSTIEYLTKQSINSSSHLALQAVKINENELSTLDPRFNVTTNIVDGKVNSYIEPKFAGIELKIAVENDNENFNNSLLKLEEGKGFSLDTNQFKVSGSPLFEKIFSTPGGVLHAVVEKQKIQCELYVINDNETLLLASCKADMYGGTKKTIIEGVALNKFLSFSTEISDKRKSTFTIQTNSWLGKKLDKLPFFPKLLKAADILNNSGEIKIIHDHPELGEIIIAKTNANELDSYKEFIIQVISLIDFVEKARTVNNYMNLDLTYQHFDIPEEEIKALNEICALTSGSIITNGDHMESSKKIKVVLKEGYCVDDIPIGATNTCIRIDVPGYLKQLFNQNIPEYCIRHQFNNVDIYANDELIENSEVELELKISDSSQYIKSLINTTRK